VPLLSPRGGKGERVRRKAAPGQLALPFPGPRRRVLSFVAPLTVAERTELNGWRPPAMPATRAECRAQGLGWQTPCPHMGCRFHLAVEVDQDTGRVTMPLGELELSEYPVTCWAALTEHDAERGTGRTDPEIARITGLSLRTVERTAASALEKLREMPELLQWLLERE
jgi:hypothetical protein